MPSNGSGVGASITSIEAISKQIELLAGEAQDANLAKAAEVLRAMAQLIRSLGTPTDKPAACLLDDLPTRQLAVVH